MSWSKRSHITVTPAQIRELAAVAYSMQSSSERTHARHLLGIPQAVAAARRAHGGRDSEATVAEALYLVVVQRSYPNWDAVRQALRWTARRMATMGHVFSCGREAEFAAMGKLLTLLRCASLEDATDEEITEYVTSLPPGKRWSAARIERALDILRVSRIVLASELVQDSATFEYYETPGCQLLLTEEVTTYDHDSDTTSANVCIDRSEERL